MYEAKMIKVGEIEEQEIVSVDMPRETFLTMVERVIDDNSDDEEMGRALRDRLMPVARTMPRFPMETWINPERGCGCLIGEYLIAQQEIGRANFINERLAAGEFESGGGWTTVQKLLAKQPLAEELQAIGNRIDHEIDEEMAGQVSFAGLPEGRRPHIDSVEFV